jgi:hypothetical protein
MKPITTAHDLEEVRSLPRALIFIYVNWAIQARQSETAFRNFVGTWSSTEPECSVPAYRVDLSDQEGEVWRAIREWLREEGQPFNELTYGGYGALLWVCSGAVVASVPYVAVVERAKLLAVTKSIFERHAESNPASDGRGVSGL